MEIYPVFLPFEGCRERCSFCAQGTLTGLQERPGPQAVAAQLDQVLPPRGDGEVAYYGGTFSWLPAAQQVAYLGVAQRFQAQGRIAGCRVSTRPDALESDQVRLLAGNGVRTVEIGCQSFSERVLRRAGRFYTSGTIAKAVATLREQGLGVGLQLMPGLPGADRSEALDSLRRAIDLRPDFLRIYPTVVFPGTGLAEEYRSGRFVPWGLDSAVDCCAEMLWLCQRAEVPVIRLGLQGRAELDRGVGILTGPYHPAFGQLVRSRLWRWALEGGLTQFSCTDWQVHPFDLADVFGHRKENLAHLRQLCPDLALRGDPQLGRNRLRSGATVVSQDQLVDYFLRNLSN